MSGGGGAAVSGGGVVRGGAVSSGGPAVRRRAIVLVLDGFGIGAMPDAADFRPADAGAFTLRSLVQACGPLPLPNLAALGLGNVATGSGFPSVAQPRAAYGRANLAHWGADTYAGHNEMQGARPLRPETMLFREAREAVAAALRDRGHDVRPALDGGSALLVDGHVLVGDNLESDPGRIYNVTGPLDAVPFADVVAIGEAVRAVVRVTRVIALGGTGITVDDILAHTVTNAAGQTGVITPDLHIYNETYQVRHLGYGIRPELQAPSRVVAAGLPVSLVGKMADVIECEGATKHPSVDTDETMALLLAAMDAQPTGYIACTVQETDLAGHEEDPAKYTAVLTRADAGLASVLTRMTADDLLIVTADHGNDPLIGHRFHTREQVPVLVTGVGVRPGPFGERATMADVAATVCDYLGAEPPEFGHSFLAAVSD